MRIPLKHWLAAFAPVPVGANAREKCYGSLGALLGLFVTEWIGRHTLGVASPWFIAPMGASSVLLFAAPASPLAQPWSILGGNVVSAVMGVTCALLIPTPGLAAAVACASAIAAMFALRCLHPPGGAVALTAVLGGSAVTQLGYGFVLWPVALNSLILVCIGVVFNGVLRRNYPRRPAEAPAHHGTRDPAASSRLGFTSADLEAALGERGELLDISREDLESIVMAAEGRAAVRRFGEVRCADIMSRDVIAVAPEDTLDHAAQLLRLHRLQALPVRDGEGHYLGMMAERDLLARQARALNPATPALVRDCLRSEVPFATPDLPIVELARPMADGLHCVPVLDAQGHVVGLVTQSDLVGALYQIALAADTTPHPNRLAA